MESVANRHNTKEIKRVEAFSEGVFAIAITLLVLELIETLHVKSDEGLLQVCLDHWQSFLAFTIGFVTILVCWINHHVALEYMTKIDTGFMWVNGFLLFVVTLTPFPTAVLAQYLEKDTATAFAMFSLNYVLISIAADGICSYAYKHHFIEAEHRDFYRFYKRIYRYAIFYNLITLGLCFVSIIIPIASNILLFAVFAAPEEFASRLYKMRRAPKTTK
jgi:TMEM175 potassium channel family protein